MNMNYSQGHTASASDTTIWARSSADYEFLPQSKKDEYKAKSEAIRESSTVAHHEQRVERLAAAEERFDEDASQFMDACFTHQGASAASLCEGELLPTMPARMSIGPNDDVVDANSLPTNINHALESNGDAFKATNFDEFKHLLHRSLNISRSEGLQPFSEHLLSSFFKRDGMFADRDPAATSWCKAPAAFKRLTTNFANRTGAPPFPEDVHHEKTCGDMCERDTAASDLNVYGRLKEFFDRVATDAGFNHKANMCHAGRVLFVMRYFAHATDDTPTITEFHYLNTGLGRWYRHDAIQMLSKLEITFLPEAISLLA